MYNFFINGSSSLLFLISTIKSFYCSNSILWKLSNVFLICASFLCNATEYSSIFLLLDYFAIYLVCISYINNIYINILFSLLLVYEYKKYNSIEKIKNLTFLIAVIKCITYNYNIILISSILFGIIIYKIRYDILHYKKYDILNKKKYNICLTYLFHICIMNIIYIASATI